ncbi:acyltransferase family protein [Bacillus sp. FJAT-45350]|uniref:acyltransferase family protein n=1 Tax=Bacillus sp. FJAT-45350 TaxID=2011014 RepID=UPI0015CD728D|nr:acyltransferase family protein [Bacillus sp. FJAT-45350]
MENKHVNEISFLRGIACLSIVFLHSIVWGVDNIGYLSNLSTDTQTILDAVTILLYYGTPTFIFITAFIFGYNYKDKETISFDFIRKRVKFILIPYICMGLFYSLPFVLISAEQFITTTFLNIFIGDFHAYFVLIIFQFYLLFVIGKRMLDRFSPLKVIVVSLVINVLYLSIFNFTEPINIPFSTYIWERYYWVPFPGWIFYFTVAYYIGANYKVFTQYLTKFKYFVMSAPIVTGLLLMSLYYSEIITIHSSKRIDILLYTISIIGFALYFSRKMNRIPTLFLTINKYSYGIYLLHTFYLAVIILLFNLYSFNFGLLTIFVLFVFSIMSSILTIYVLNKFSFGKYIVGKVDVTPLELSSISSKLRMKINSYFVNFKS